MCSSSSDDPDLPSWSGFSATNLAQPAAALRDLLLDPRRVVRAQILEDLVHAVDADFLPIPRAVLAQLADRVHHARPVATGFTDEELVFAKKTSSAYSLEKSNNVRISSEHCNTEIFSQCSPVESLNL